MFNIYVFIQYNILGSMTKLSEIYMYVCGTVASVLRYSIHFFITDKRCSSFVSTHEEILLVVA